MKRDTGFRACGLPHRPPRLHHHAAELSPALKSLLLEAVRVAHGTIVTEVFHTFSPHGVSGIVVIAESHVAIHTWFEHAYAAVDIFSCGTKLDHTIIRDHLHTGLAATNIEARELTRE